MILPSILINIPFYRCEDETIGIVGIILVTIQVIILFASIFTTETALKKTFNDDGTQK